MRQIAIFVLATLAVSCGVPPTGLAPIAAAARGGDAEAIRALVVRGADPNEPAGSNGWTPLMHAIHKHQIASVAALIDNGADVNRPTAGLQTPLMMAAGYGHTDIVRLLLRHGADVRARDANGESAVDWALAGMNDLDRFTMFDCQDATVRALAAAGARAKPGASLKWAKLKRCGAVVLVKVE